MEKTNSGWWKWALLPVVLVLAALAYLSFNDQKAAPQLSFTDVQGKVHSAQDLRGKVMIINFWATSCATCIKEMPQLAQTYEKFKPRGLEFFAVAMKYDPPNYVLNFTETRKLPFPVTLDVSGEIAKAYGDVSLTPTTFIVGKDGKILKRYVGEPSFTELHALLEKALAA